MANSIAIFELLNVSQLFVLQFTANFLLLNVSFSFENYYFSCHFDERYAKFFLICAEETNESFLMTHNDAKIEVDMIHNNYFLKTLWKKNIPTAEENAI